MQPWSDSDRNTNSTKRRWSDIRKLSIHWHGPFSWPGYEAETLLPTLPNSPGVYMETYALDDAFLVRGCGVTTRSVLRRFKEHAYHYRAGTYNVLDMKDVLQAQRRLLHQGSWWREKNVDGPRLEGQSLQEAVDLQFRMLRLFVAEVREEKRILERVESAVMNRLYRSGPPFCDFLDKGTFRVVRQPDEPPIWVTMNFDRRLLALPERLLV
jgi:hypothetical protein